MSKLKKASSPILLILCGVALAICTLILLVTWPHHYQPPYHAKVTDFVVSPLAIPGGDPDAKWYRYYQTSFWMENTSTQLVILDPYLFDYQAAEKDLHVSFLRDEDHSPLLPCNQALPSGKKTHISHSLRISINSSDKADIFPMRLYFGSHDARILVAEAKVVTEVAPLEP